MLPRERSLRLHKPLGRSLAKDHSFVSPHPPEFNFGDLCHLTKGEHVEGTRERPEMSGFWAQGDHPRGLHLERWLPNFLPLRAFGTPKEWIGMFSACTYVHPTTSKSLNLVPCTV